MSEQIISASQFKAKCLQLMDEVQKSGKEIIITKNGKPVSRLAPITNKPATLFGAHKGQVKVTGDILSPLEEQREAMR